MSTIFDDEWSAADEAAYQAKQVREHEELEQRLRDYEALPQEEKDRLEAIDFDEYISDRRPEPHWL